MAPDVSMTMQIDETTEAKISNYVSLSQLYLQNSNKMIQKKEYSKAGEMIWGAVAIVIKAIGIRYGERTKNHKEIINLAKRIALQSQDNDLREGIVKYAGGFHANYYENFIEPEDFSIYFEKSMESYKKLIALLLQQGTPSQRTST